jgi:hypothetical protein
MDNVKKKQQLLLVTIGYKQCSFAAAATQQPRHIAYKKVDLGTLACDKFMQIKVHERKAGARIMARQTSCTGRVSCTPTTVGWY